jgi:hypothetical protein
MNTYYKAELNGQIEVRNSKVIYEAVTFLVGKDGSQTTTWHKKLSSAGKAVNPGGYFQPVGVVLVSIIDKAEFNSIKAGA